MIARATMSTVAIGRASCAAQCGSIRATAAWRADLAECGYQSSPARVDSSARIEPEVVEALRPTRRTVALARPDRRMRDGIRDQARRPSAARRQAIDAQAALSIGTSSPSRHGWPRARPAAQARTQCRRAADNALAPGDRAERESSASIRSCSSFSRAIVGRADAGIGLALAVQHQDRAFAIGDRDGARCRPARRSSRPARACVSPSRNSMREIAGEDQEQLVGVGMAVPGEFARRPWRCAPRCRCSGRRCAGSNDRRSWRASRRG